MKSGHRLFCRDFAPPSKTNPALSPQDSPALPLDYETEDAILARHPPHADLALEYLDIVLSLKTHTTVSGVKGHLFKLMRPALGIETDLRERLGKIRVDPKKVKEGLQQYVEVCQEMKTRMDVSVPSSLRIELC